MQIPESNCSIRRCKHFAGIGAGREELDGVPIHVNVCRAFPLGIPEEIAYGTNKHLKPYRDDGGIRFEEET